MEADASELQSLEDEFGPVLLKKKHPVLLRWIRREIRILQMIRRKLLGAMYKTEGRPGNVFLAWGRGIGKAGEAV